MSNEIQSECTGYEFAMGSLHGIRAFKSDPLGRLRGLNYPHVWTPGENLATCRKGESDLITYTLRGAWSSIFDPSPRVTVDPKPEPPEKHKGIDPSCTCGFYAYHDGVADYGQDATTLTGIVECYGKTTVGTRGVRAEKARIVALVEPRTTVEWRHFRLLAWALAAWATLTLVAPLLPQTTPWHVASLIVSVLIGWPLYYGARRIWKRKPVHRSKLTRAQIATIRGNYPDVPWFRTPKAALRAFPMRESIAPSPETDPTFWVRPS